MEENNITNAKYIVLNDEAMGIVNKKIGVQCVYNGRNMTISMKQGNYRYQEILRQVEAGTLTIAEAD